MNAREVSLKEGTLSESFRLVSVSLRGPVVLCPGFVLKDELKAVTLLPWNPKRGYCSANTKLTQATNDSFVRPQKEQQMKGNYRQLGELGVAMP